MIRAHTTATDVRPHRPCTHCGTLHQSRESDFCKPCREAPGLRLPDGPRHRRRWTADEDTLLTRLAQSHPVPQLAVLFCRSEEGIYRRLVDLGLKTLSPRLAEGGMQMHEVVSALGSTYTAVAKWIESGNLTTVQRTRVRGQRVTISAEALIAYLERGGALNPNLQPIGMWATIVRDIRAELEQRWIDSFALAQALGIVPQTLWCHLRKKSFPRPVWHGVNNRAYYDKAAVSAWLDAHSSYWSPAARHVLEHT